MLIDPVWCGRDACVFIEDGADLGRKEGGLEGNNVM